MDKVLVAGINGFSGFHFREYTRRSRLTENFHFTGTSRRAGEDSEIPTRIVDPLKDEMGLEDCLLDVLPQYIVNFIGSFSSDDFGFLFRINAGISMRICETILRCGIPVKKLLLVGSAAEYGNTGKLPISESDPTHPVSPYGLTKLFQTQIARYYFENHGIPVVVARPFNMLGKNLSGNLSIGNFVRQILANRDGEPVRVGNLDSKRDFLDAQDVMDGYWKILMSGHDGEIYNVCRGESVSIKDIVEFLVKASGKELPILVRNDLIRKNDFLDSYGDNSKLHRHTGWAWKTGIHESLKRMLI
jgi:GDP-4-dehydro-6-deoxy-D-mannose reductase